MAADLEALLLAWTQLNSEEIATALDIPIGPVTDAVQVGYPPAPGLPRLSLRNPSHHRRNPRGSSRSGGRRGHRP